ncbi:MAG TPA: response regulator [Candidatus Omnitrophica bacterium]|nr:response regulator [Candidatus Omnitrophota bacterium]
MAKILVIDDEYQILDILERFLVKMGFQVITALGGEEGIKAIDSQDVDLIILDMKMPKVTGIDVLKELRKKEKRMPVLILSGSLGIVREVELLKELGYTQEDIVTKPIDLFNLLERVRSKLPPDII